MKKFLLVLVIIILMVLSFMFGWSLKFKKITDEMIKGPIYGENTETIYFQDLYETAYRLGVMKGVLAVCGDKSDPMYQTYYEWMQQYYTRSDDAIYDEYEAYKDELQDKGLEYYADILEGLLS